jgi:hypothetical protein
MGEGESVGAQVRACACARVALIMEHATRPHIVNCGASLAPPNLSTLSHERHDFRKKFTDHKMCVLIFCTTSI